jgi:hypothetical protein
MTASDGADALGPDEHGVSSIIAGLMGGDFDKSVPFAVNPAIWQDVYNPVIAGREL